MSPGFRVTSTTSTVLPYRHSSFLVSARALTGFAVIDHAAGAAGADLTLAPETVIVFGNPAAGTALLQAYPRVGLVQYSDDDKDRRDRGECARPGGREYSLDARVRVRFSDVALSHGGLP